ncbi:MAG: thioester domain-containing protein [Ruminiclostridium sp.]|nr:thioester domain-containing protein [Ruminiclostridium sp.]
MANEKMKKAVAITLAMAMCWSTLSVQAFAAEQLSAITTPTAPGNGTAEAPAVTVTVTVQENGNTTTTKTESVWTGKTESETGDGENDGTTTTVTGSETKTETETVDSKDRVTKETGHVEGSETTETKTTETEVKKGQVIPGGGTEDINKTEDIAGGEGKTEYGAWQDGNPQYGEWQDGTLTPVTGQDTDEDGWKETVPETTTEDDLSDPLDTKDVTLNLTPGKKTQETIEIEETKLKADSVWNAFDFKVIEDLQEAKDGRIETTEGNQKIVKEAIYGEADEDGNKPILGYKVTTITTTPDVQPGAPGDPVASPRGEDAIVTVPTEPTLPDNWDEDAGDVTDETGKVIGKIEMTKEPIYGADANGNKIIIGYKIIKTTTTDYDNTANPAATGETTKVTEPTETTFLLPTKPAESEKTENGVTTKVVVEDVYDGDKHVGYKTITTKTKNGKVVYTGAETIYGTTTTVNKTIETDPTTKKVTTDTTTVTTETTEIYGYTQTSIVDLTQNRTTNIKTTEVTNTEEYELVTTEEGVFFLYKGEMYAVTAIEDSHGITTLNPLQPDMDLITAKKGSDLRDKNGTSDGLFDSLKYDSKNPNDYEFRYVGNGLASNLLINRYNGGWGNITNHQFALKDSGGNIHYVYCADIATDANRGYFYDIDNLDDADYYQGENPIAHIRAIALNGYWGTTGDATTTGSLEAVKALLREHDLNDVAATLTEGQALTATQAAIWKFGNMDGNRKLGDRIVQSYYNGTSIGAAAADSKNTQALYELLISLTDTTKSETDIIDAEDITGATIVLDKKAVDENGNVKTDANGNEKYDTDLSFTLAVSKSSINGDLLVYVYANGDTSNPVTVKRLAGTNDAGETYERISSDENGTYTIPDLELAEGVAITLNLEGTQNLNKGVYIYTSEAIGGTVSQTFVGVAEGTRQVDLEVSMKFEVEEPDAEKSTSEREKNETRTDTRTGTRQDTRSKTTTQNMGGSSVTTGTKTTVVYADVTVTEVTETETNREWTEDWEETFTYPSNNKPEVIIPENTPTDPVDPVDPVIPDEPTPETPVDPEIPEEPVPEAPVDIPDETPLADVPKTGDISALWYGLTLLSGGGLVGLLTGRKGKEEQ